MKAIELMVDDWVLVDKKPIKVKQVCEDCVICDFSDSDEEVDCFEPIPLTPEILVQNKFEARGCGCFVYTYSYGWFLSRINVRVKVESCLLHIDFGDIRDCLQSVKLEIKYVHELQHALRMCKIDKEIVL